jgi:hypothetical protein
MIDSLVPAGRTILVQARTDFPEPSRFIRGLLLAGEVLLILLIIALLIAIWLPAWIGPHAGISPHPM